ncbi:MAG: class I adenylate-forming enzyme family protein, partial [Acidimicrobiales bacterium]
RFLQHRACGQPMNKEEAPVASMSIDEADATLTAPGQMFEMEEIDIRGVATRIWKNCPGSLKVVLDLSLGHGDKTFLVYEDERTTFKEHYGIAASIARALSERFGVNKGDRVSIAMRNLPEWAMAFWGITSIGAIVVPINAWWTGPELQYGLADSGSSVVFVDSERLARIRPVLSDLPDLTAVIVTNEDRKPHIEITDSPVPIISFTDLIADAASDPVFPDVAIEPEDDATIFYTSGTTGKPKGAVGTHRNICTNLMSLFFSNTRLGMREGKEKRMTADPDEATESQGANLLSVPFFHATGCHAILVGNTAAGGKLVLMHHWDPERALELIERERITIFGGVPAMVMQVLDSPNFESRDTSSVRSIAYGGAPAPPELVRRISEHFPTGSPSNGYGLTETSSVTTMNNGNDYVRKPDSVGRPVPVCDVSVVPEEFAGSHPTPDLPTGPDVTGELWIKGPNVVRGYWNKPDESVVSFTEGWLHSGDVGRIDEEGFVYVVDRAKDVVIRGGENVYSVEIEATLFEHPAVADVAVIGVPHPVLGEEVGAVVVLRPGTNVSADELSTFVRERMAGFNVPTHVWFRSEPLPRNPQGKVLKRELRDELVGAATEGGAG